MKWWEKPRSVEDIRLMAWHALLRDPNSVQSYVMIGGRPVYSGEARLFREITQAVRRMIPAFEKLGKEMDSISQQFAEFAERASYKQHGVKGLHLP